MDFSSIVDLAVGQIKQYIVHRTYPFPDKTIGNLREAMQQSTAEETLLIVEVGTICDEWRGKVERFNADPYAAYQAPVPVYVITSQRKTMFVLNVEMTVEITVTVRRDS